MRLRSFTRTLSVLSFVLLGGAFTIEACSSSDVVGDDVADAAEAGARDVPAIDSAPDEPPCDRARDLFAKVHDAAIGDGVSTTGLCLSCARKECPEAIAHCTQDCPCQLVVGNALECYLKTKQIGCAQELANIFVTNQTRQYALSLLGCVESSCPVECDVEAGAGDAGDAGDAGGDAGAD